MCENLMHVLLASNDTVSISVWHGRDVHSDMCRLVVIIVTLFTSLQLM